MTIKMPAASSSLPDSSGTYRVIYSFAGTKEHEDGSWPVSPLIEVAGTLYGATSLGGIAECGGPTEGCGTIYSITTSGNEHILYRFHGYMGGIGPSSLIYVHDNFYGDASKGGTGCGGGKDGCGAVFEMSPEGKERIVHSFTGASGGKYPFSSLRYAWGELYGTTFFGGPANNGTLFKVSLSGDANILHRFAAGKDGEWPTSTLISANGVLYGTTGSGGGASWCHRNIGSPGCGTIFSVDSSGTYHLLYRFRGGRYGATPGDELVAVKGLLYGTTVDGGESSYCPGGCGTVFEFDPKSGRETTIYRFKGSDDGWFPAGALMEYRGLLYGTTSYGGTGYGPCSISGYGHCGTIYSISTSGVHRVLHNFQGADGNRPTYGHLLEVGGKLYGTTELGGANCHHQLGCGTVFEFTPPR